MVGAIEGLGVFLLVSLLFVALGAVGNPWYRTVIVTSGSMQPVFSAGDMIVATRPPARLEVGMIVVMTMEREMVTHRIVAIDPATGDMTTQGDANNAPDGWVIQPGDASSRIRVVGLYRGRIPYVGFAVDWLGRQLRGLTGQAEAPGQAGVLGPSTRAEFRDSASIGGEFVAGAWAAE